MANRVAHAVGVDLAPAAVAVHADDAADPGLGVEVHLLRREDVEGLAERDVDLVVRPDGADPRRVVVAFLLDRNQLATRNHFKGGDVGALVEELGRRIDQHAVLLGDVEEAIVGKAGTVRDREVDRRSEILHLVGDAVFVAVGNRPDRGFARADEGHNALRSDRHVARVRHHGIELDLEPAGQIDAFEGLTDAVGIGAALLDDLEFRHAGGLEGAELLQVALRQNRRREEQGRQGHQG